jgi:hypothetical protein
VKFVITYREEGRVEFPILIRKAFESVKKLGYSTVLVGTEVAEADEYIPSDRSDEQHLCNWILQARQLYMKKLFDCNTVFIDPDVLVVRPLDVFDRDFDLAVTERDVKSAPINTGVMFAKPENKEKLIKFWDALRDKAKTYPFGKQRWFSDQMAVNDLIDSDHGLRVLKLPCDLYNASPCINNTPEKVERNRLMAEHARILHFKGYRKNMMYAFN